MPPLLGMEWPVRTAGAVFVGGVLVTLPKLHCTSQYREVWSIIIII